MARLKFLLFSLVVLGLWAAHLFLLSPALSARAVEQARSGASSAPASVSSVIDARRIAVQRAALVVSSSALADAAFGSGTAPPAADKLEALRAAVADQLPVELRDALIIALAHPAGTVAVQGSGAAAEPPADFDVAAVTGSGIAGATRHAFGANHLFSAVPVQSLERGAPKVLGHVIVGAPLITDAMLDAAARSARIDGIALLKDGEVVMAAGAQKELARKVGPRAAPEKSDVVEQGQVSSLGPVKLPILTAGDVMGGSAPLWIAARRTLEGTPYEIVTLASVAPFMSALGDYQQTAIWMFAGLLGLSVVFLLILGGKPQPARAPARQEPLAMSAPQAVAAPPPAPMPLAESAPEPEASSDDFPFGAPPAPKFAAPPESEPETMVAPEAELAAAPEAEPSPEPEPAFAGEPWASSHQEGAPPEFPEEPPTRSVPMMNHAALFAEVQAAQAAQEQAAADGEFNPEATRVATVPQELLQAATKAADEPSSAAPQPFAFAPPPVQAAAENPEEVHFQEVFREFLQTREACGEGGDGLTYERFALKLRKNREQLVTKYSCRTVRFQVYVKEGKAALKATPIKD